MERMYLSSWERFGAFEGTNKDRSLRLNSIGCQKGRDAGWWGGYMAAGGTEK